MDYFKYSLRIVKAPARLMKSDRINSNKRSLIQWNSTSSFSSLHNTYMRYNIEVYLQISFYLQLHANKKNFVGRKRSRQRRKGMKV